MSEIQDFNEASEGPPAELGNVQAELRAGWENIIAGVVISVAIVVAAGILETKIVREAMQTGWQMPVWVEKGISWGALVLITAIVLGMLVGAVLLFRYALSLRSRRTSICEHGLWYVDRRQKEPIAWLGIACIVETVTQKHFPLKGVGRHLLPMGKERSYLIRRSDGREFSFNGNEVKPIGLLGQTLEVMAETHSIPWQIVQATAG